MERVAARRGTGARRRERRRVSEDDEEKAPPPPSAAAAHLASAVVVPPSVAACGLRQPAQGPRRSRPEAMPRGGGGGVRGGGVGGALEPEGLRAGAGQVERKGRKGRKEEGARGLIFFIFFVFHHFVDCNLFSAFSLLASYLSLPAPSRHFNDIMRNAKRLKFDPSSFR